MFTTGGRLLDIQNSYSHTSTDTDSSIHVSLLLPSSLSDIFWCTNKHFSIMLRTVSSSLLQILLRGCVQLHAASITPPGREVPSCVSLWGFLILLGFLGVVFPSSCWGLRGLTHHHYQMPTRYRIHYNCNLRTVCVSWQITEPSRSLQLFHSTVRYLVVKLWWRLTPVEPRPLQRTSSCSLLPSAAPWRQVSGTSSLRRNSMTTGWTRAQNVSKDTTTTVSSAVRGSSF